MFFWNQIPLQINRDFSPRKVPLANASVLAAIQALSRDSKLGADRQITPSFLRLHAYPEPALNCMKRYQLDGSAVLKADKHLTAVLNQQ